MLFRSVTWSSSAPGIAEVNNGRVTAIAAGVATISAKTVDGGLTASCQITVTDETTGNSEMLTPQVYAVPGAVRIVLPYPETVYIFSLDALRIHVLLLCRRYGLLGRISLLSPGYLLSVERRPAHAGSPDH